METLTLLRHVDWLSHEMEKEKKTQKNGYHRQRMDFQMFSFRFCLWYFDPFLSVATQMKWVSRLKTKTFAMETN